MLGRMSASDDEARRNLEVELHLLELRRLIARSEELKAENLRVMADIDAEFATIKQTAPDKLPAPDS